jgi:hypothetical protein
MGTLQGIRNALCECSGETCSAADGVQERGGV